MFGLMQDGALSLDRVVRRMETACSTSTLVTQSGATREHISYGELAVSVRRLAQALVTHGVVEGDTVATLAYNTRAHLELALAVPMIGAIFQAVNPKLSADQVRYVLTHGGAQLLFVDEGVLDELRPVIESVPAISAMVTIDQQEAVAPATGIVGYAEFVGDAEPLAIALAKDERLASGLFHTTGTTGLPKGVLYSHRSTLLHALSLGLVDVFGISVNDRVLPIVPIFHANAWGLVHASGLIGADLVLPGRDLSGESLGALIRDEAVTIAAGVPTVVDGLLRFADENEGSLASLRYLITGGSGLPRRILKGFERHGIEVVQGWGMTETSPNVSMSWAPRGVDAEAAEEYRLSAGRLNPLVDAKLVSDSGGELPWDGESSGEIWLQTPHGASGYFNTTENIDDKFADGWLRTGDVASIDPRGYVRLRDRLKDAIKSGGEFISSLEIEAAIATHPAVNTVAVIGKQDEKWGERPVAIIVLHPGGSLSSDEVVEHLRSRIPKWWLPEEVVFIDSMPLTSVGKPDKKALRERGLHRSPGDVF